MASNSGIKTLSQNKVLSNYFMYKFMKKNETKKSFGKLLSWRQLWCCCLMLIGGLLLTDRPAFSQATTQANVSLKLKQVTVLDALRELNRQYDRQLMFKREEVEQVKEPVSVDVKKVTLLQAVEACIRGTGLVATDRNGIIVIGPARQTTPPVSRVIQGIVRDEQGNPLPGATIKIKGTRMGTATDFEGRFQLALAGNAQVLEVSFIGYRTVEVNVQGKKEIEVRLQPDQAEMEEVVVTGYQTIRKERMTGTTATITANQIAGRGLQSIDEILNSTISGLNMISSGRPGQDAQIQIRGVNSLTGSTEPMWIVDGMPLQGEIPNIQSGSTDLQATIFTTGIGNIAPDDIKSITVLKDAAATAIYGARAANGVIVVETKSGLSGKTRFNASVNVGITERPRNNIDMMNTAEKIQFEREIFYDQQGYIYTPGRVTKLLQQAAYGEISSDEAERRIGELAKINTDWFKEIYRTAISQQYNFSMSGGNEKTQHYVSLNYLKEVGTEPNNKYDRLGMNIKLTHNPSEKIRITGGLGATMKNDRVTASSVNSLEYAMYANPYERLKNEDGTKAYDISYNAKESSIRDGLDWDTFNILDDLNRNTNTNRYLDAELSLKVEWEIVKGLMFTTHGVYNANSNHNRIIEGADTYTNFINNWYSYKGEIPHDMVKGSLREATGYTNAYTFRNTLQYTGEYAGKHYISLFAGQEIQERTAYNSFNYSPVFDEEHRIVGFPEMDDIDGSEINYSALGGTGKSVSKMSSFFANASYSYLDKYILTGALRYDGSDIIGNDNQFTPLWNVGLRWNLHREEFMKRWMWVDQFAVRGGFGYTGSIDKNALPFVVMTLGQSVIYDGQTVPTSFSYPNPNVKWQTKQDMNVGLDLSLFDYRLELGVNYYNNITRDVLDRKALPYSSGRSEVTENVADIYNSGWEIDLGVTLLKNKSFQWYAKANIAINDNKVKNTYYKDTKDLPKATLSNAHQFVENQPVNGWYGYKFAGINPINGAVMTYTGNGEATLDMSVSGATWPTPSVFYLGNLTPPVVGGFSTSANWKQLIFSANFEFKTGHKIKSFNTFRSLDARNRHTSEANRWREPGDITNVPAMSEVYTSYSSYMYDILLEKGNYLRCSYMTLGYNLKPEWLHKIGFSTARLSFTAKDLFTISSYSGIDPALMGSFGYPNSRKYTITLNVGF